VICEEECYHRLLSGYGGNYSANEKHFELIDYLELGGNKYEGYS